MTRKRFNDRSAWTTNRQRLRSTEHEPPPDNAFVPISKVLAGIFKKIEATRRPWLEQLHEEWDSLTNDLAPGHMRPAGLRGRTLVVYVDSSVWLNEIVRYKRSALLARLQKQFGDDQIKNISLRLDPGEKKR